MAEALVFMGNNVHLDPDKDRRGCWKRGYVVVVKPDGHEWGREEDPALLVPPRKFALLKLPGVSVARVERYLVHQFDHVTGETFRRRLWQIQHAEFPAALRQKIANTGILTVGPDGDIFWEQFRQYLMRLDTNTRETEALAA